MVLTMFGSWQEVKPSFISVFLPRDDAASHQALVGSHTLGLRVITESTGVIGGLLEVVQSRNYMDLRPNAEPYL